MTVDKSPKRKTTRKPKPASTPDADAVFASPAIAPVDRQQMIEREAYLRAERRGFEPGHELEDWLAAEHSLGARADA